MPALYHLSREQLLPPQFKVLGMGRRIKLGDEFRSNMQNRTRQYCSHKMEDRYWLPLAESFISLRADYKQENTFGELKSVVEKIEQEWGSRANKLFYLATNPSHFDIIISGLARVGLNEAMDGYWTRVIVEKPFGLDHGTAESLDNTISNCFDESQIFRIDHFLGKEAVQNILVFRISNVMFQPLWNRDYIDHIQITSAETIGVEGRADFFEQTGAVRDMVQSHLLQLLAFLTMEHPHSLDPEVIRDQKVLLLKSIRKYKEDEIGDNAIRAQYLQGVVNSELVASYVDEPHIDKDSKVETYAAMRLFIDNYRWRGVPIYLRTGKRMPNRKTEILIQLKSPEDREIPTLLFKEPPVPNYIKLEIQPRAGVEVKIGWKPIGLLSEIEPINLHVAGKVDIKEPKAYERLLMDAMRGDSTLFVRFDEIREMWRIVDPIISYWNKQDAGELETTSGGRLNFYHAGSQGPNEAKSFTEKDNFSWTKI